MRLVPVKASATRVRVRAPLHHICPFVAEEDDGEIELSWLVNGHTVELHSLREWLADMSEEVISHEEITTKIRTRLMASLRGVEVRTFWRTADMTVEVTACSTSPTPAG